MITFTIIKTKMKIMSKKEIFFYETLNAVSGDAHYVIIANCNVI